MVLLLLAFKGHAINSTGFVLHFAKLSLMLVDKIFKLFKRLVNIVSLHNIKCDMPWFTECNITLTVLPTNLHRF